jgi:hypothetical protein
LFSARALAVPFSNQLNPAEPEIDMVFFRIDPGEMTAPLVVFVAIVIENAMEIPIVYNHRALRWGYP